MSAIRLYFDADSMERAVVTGLRARGVDAISALEAGMADCSDEGQMEFATSEGRVLFTYNISDFHRIHGLYLENNSFHTGLILSVQQRYSVGERIRRLQKLVSILSAESMVNRVEFLGNWGE